MAPKTGPRILTSIAVLTMVVSGIGFIGMLIANAFFLDEYDKYGEVPIPGSSSLHFEAGDVTVTFHTVLIGGSGAGLPVPPIKYRITGPGGVDVELAEDYGGTTTVNNDARRRIGYLHVPAAGSYDISLDGNVGAFLNPSLTFGRDGGYGSVPWISAAVFVVAVFGLILARVWAARVARRPVPIEGYRSPPGYGATSFGTPTYPPPPTYTPQVYDAPPSAHPPGSYAPSDQGIRLAQLNNLARLRDSGALTQEEFEAEKKRVLES